MYLGQMITCKQCNHSFVGAEADQPGEISIGAHTTGPSAQPARDVERILVVCENCKVSLSVKSSRIGQVIRCKQCDGEILVKAARETQPAPALSALGSVSAEHLLQLAIEHGMGDAQHDQLRSECAALQAELETLAVSHNLREAELERLRLVHSEVEAENKSLAELLKQREDELNATRPEKARADALQSDREQLVGTLEERTTDLTVVRAERDSLAELLKQREDELNATRPEKARADALQSDREQLAGTLEERTTDLTVVRAERDSLAELLKQREDELNTTRAEKARADAEQSRGEQLARTLEERTTDLTVVRAERDSLAELLKQREEELNATRGEHLRADMERQVALVDIEQHRSRADRDQAMYQTEIEGLRQTLDLQRRDHDDELVRRSAHLDELSEQYRRLRDQLDSTELAMKEYQDRNQELFEAEIRREADFRSQLDAERRRQEQLEAELRVLRAESAAFIETVPRGARPQPLGPESGSVGPTRDEELESARAEIVKLREQLGESERLQREISSVLNGLGLRFDLG